VKEVRKMKLMARVSSIGLIVAVLMMLIPTKANAMTVDDIFQAFLTVISYTSEITEAIHIVSVSAEMAPDIARIIIAKAIQDAELGDTFDGGLLGGWDP
jgi:hypothetical protein